MEIQTIDSFLAYFERTRRITSSVVRVIPPDKLDWSYKPGKFTTGDLVRHIAAIERNLFAEVVSGRPSAYTGCGKKLADGFEAVVTYFDDMHEQSMQIFRSLRDQDLARRITSLNGRATSTANFLRALVVHEIHHRGALCIYLNLLNVETPAVLGLTEEQVIQISK